MTRPRGAISHHDSKPALMRHVEQHRTEHEVTQRKRVDRPAVLVEMVRRIEMRPGMLAEHHRHRLVRPTFTVKMRRDAMISPVPGDWHGAERGHAGEYVVR